MSEKHAIILKGVNKRFGKTQAVATVTSPQLDGHGGLVSAGAPVTAELELRNTGWVTRAGDQVRALLAQVPGLIGRIGL